MRSAHRACSRRSLSPLLLLGGLTLHLLVFGTEAALADEASQMRRVVLWDLPIGACQDDDGDCEGDPLLGWVFALIQREQEPVPRFKTPDRRYSPGGRVVASPAGEEPLWQRPSQLNPAP